MKLTVTGRHMEVPTAARQAIDRKLKRLERVLNDSAISAQCVLSQQRGVVVCEMTVHARQDHILHGIGRHAQLARAVGLAADKVAQQAQRLKDRWTTRRRADVGAGQGQRRGAFSANGAAVDRAETASNTGGRGRDGGGGKIVRYRRTAAKPMSVDDALLELTNSDGSVMVFRDAASDGVSVLCRRTDGNFWLIEPDL